MTFDMADRMAQRAHTTRAFEDVFGNCHSWPLIIRAAHAQLDQLEDLIGADRFRDLMECAEEGITDRTRLGRSDLHPPYLGRALYRRHGDDDKSEEAQVAWGIMFGLSVLRPEETYERVVLAAARAAVPAAVPTPTPR